MLEVVLVGDPRVGKSSLIQRFCSDSFSSSYQPTTNINYRNKHIISTTQKLKLRIWDTVTQDILTTPLGHYCKETTGFILMYSMENPDSFKHLTTTIEALQKDMNGKVNAVVVGNKLSEKETKISVEDVKHFTAKYHLKHYEVNIRDDLEVDQPFMELVATLNRAVGKRPDLMDSGAKVKEILPDEKHLQIADAFTSEDSKFTRIRTRHSSSIGDKSLLIGEELEATIRRLIRETMLEVQSVNDIYFETFEKKPIDEVMLEHKQELVDLASGFNEFRTFIISEIQQRDEQTKEQLRQIEEQHNLLFDKMETAPKNEKPKSIPDTQLELDFYDNNVPQTTVQIGFQTAEEEIYKLKQKLEGYDKKLSEGLCYMENKLKLTCAALSKQVRYLSMPEKISENDMEDKISEARTTTHVAQTRKASLFSPIAGIYRKHGEVQTFGEAVDNHNLSLAHTPILATRKSSLNHELKHEIEGDVALERRATSLETLDLSSEDIHHLPERLNLSMGLLEDHHEEQAQQDDEVAEEENEINEENEVYEQAEEEIGEVRYETADNYGEVKQEIASIWNTLNKVINNTQDRFQELKSEIANTSMNNNKDSHFASMEKSILEHRASTDPLHRQAPDSEKNIRDVITEVKDDVHNQIVHVQKELEEKVVMLRDDILCQYASFSQKIELEQLDIKKYIDERIDNTKQEIQESLQGHYEENVIHSRLALEEKEEQGLFHREESIHESLMQLQKEKEAREQEDKIQKDMIQNLKNKLCNLEESVMNSVWNTLNLVAGRLEKVELAVKSVKK